MLASVSHLLLFCKKYLPGALTKEVSGTGTKDAPPLHFCSSVMEQGFVLVMGIPEICSIVSAIIRHSPESDGTGEPVRSHIYIF